MQLLWLNKYVLHKKIVIKKRKKERKKERKKDERRIKSCLIKQQSLEATNKQICIR